MRDPKTFLPDEAIHAACRRWRETGDPRHLDPVILSFDGYAKAIARRYLDARVDADDLFAEARIGLIEGVRRFDPLKGFKLGTYVQWWIRARCTMYVFRSKWAVSVSVTRQDRAVFSSGRRLERELGEHASAEAIGAVLQVPADRVRAFRSLSRLPVDIEEADLPDRKAQSPEIGALHAEMRAAIADLPRREAEVIARHLFDEETLQQIGDALGVTRERARQLEAKGMKRLKERLGDGKIFRRRGRAGVPA